MDYFRGYFLVLRYTGALSGLSVVTSSALMKTGIMNIDVDANKAEEPFDYNFTVRDLQGNVVDFNQFKGKTVFLNLWATWCGPCVAELPSIDALYGKMDKDKTVFIVLNWFEDSKKVAKFIKNKNFTFPVYVVDGDVPKQLNVASIPVTFVISPDGNIATKKVGSANYDTDKFKTYLEGLTATQKE
jgi:thiol-disulfide isomerase/thioredoxin